MTRSRVHGLKDVEEESGGRHTSLANRMAGNMTGALSQKSSRPGLKVAINEKPYVHPLMQSRNTSQATRRTTRGRGMTAADLRNKGPADDPNLFKE